MSLHRRRSRPLLWLIALAAVAVLGGPLHSASPQDGRRVVAIGDIHGAYESLTGILRAAGLIDERERWSGGKTMLVQTGDMFDRGAGVRRVVDLLMRLEGEARRAGGRVEVALGNHEVMNILHDFRDVSPEAIATFADARSEDRRERAFAEVVAMAKRQTPAGAPPDRAAWMQSHPPGFIEYTEAVAPRGRYGRWLRDRKLVIKEGDTIFMHAGIGPETAGGVDDVNRLVAREIAAWDDRRAMLVQAGLIRPFFTLQETLDAAVTELRRISAALEAKQPLEENVTREYVEALQGLTQMGKSPLLTEEGPLWFRGFARWPPDQEPQVKALLDRVGAARVVCGHTPVVASGITSRFNGLVILLDTGMLTSYFKGGRASALEMQGGELNAIYLDKREPLVQAAGK
jgi:hypothetical protein